MGMILSVGYMDGDMLMGLDPTLAGNGCNRAYRERGPESGLVGSIPTPRSLLWPLCRYPEAVRHWGLLWATLGRDARARFDSWEWLYRKLQFAIPRSRGEEGMGLKRCRWSECDNEKGYCGHDYCPYHCRNICGEYAHKALGPGGKP